MRYAVRQLRRPALYGLFYATSAAIVWAIAAPQLLPAFFTVWAAYVIGSWFR